MPNTLKNDEVDRDRPTLRPELAPQSYVRSGVSDVFEVVSLESRIQGIAHVLTERYGKDKIKVNGNRVQVNFTDPHNEIVLDFYGELERSGLEPTIEEDDFSAGERCYTIVSLSLR